MQHVLMSIVCLVCESHHRLVRLASDAARCSAAHGACPSTEVQQRYSKNPQDACVHAKPGERRRHCPFGTGDTGTRPPGPRTHPGCPALVLLVVRDTSAAPRPDCGVRGDGRRMQGEQ